MVTRFVLILLLGVVVTIWWLYPRILTFEDTKYHQLRTLEHHSYTIPADFQVGIVTLVTRDSYVDGALSLMKSLDQYGSALRPHVEGYVVLTSHRLSPHNLERLRAVGYETVFIDDVLSIPLPDILEDSDVGNGGSYKDTVSKITVWRLTQFQVCLYLDSDIIAVQNPVSVLSYYKPGTISGVVGTPLLNTGVFLVEPSLEIFDQMLQTCRTDERWITSVSNIGDQDLISHWYQHRFTSMPRIYNAIMGFHWNPRNVFLHFNGKHKPWDPRWSARMILRLATIVGVANVRAYHNVVTRHS